MQVFCVLSRSEAWIMSVIMEETSAQKKQEKKLMEKLLKKTNFSLLEIEKLLFTYRKTVVDGF